MKIALVSGEFPPMEGGVGAFTQELGRALHAQRHELHIITSSKARPADAGRAHLGRHAEPYDLGFAYLHAQIGGWRWPSVAKIADLTLRYEFDVVNIQYQAAAYNMNSLAANLMPWRLKHLAKTIVTFHDLRTAYLFPKAGSLREKAISFMANQATGIITTNQEDFDALSRRTRTPLTAIPIGSNINAYEPNHIEIAAIKDDLGLDDSTTLIGYFGFLNPSKGADVLINALSQLPHSYHLVFIGGITGASDETNQTYLASVRELIKTGGLLDRVHWTGFLSDTRVSAHLKACDLVAMPYQDGVSLRRGTLMAALAHGCPLITTEPQSPVTELIHRQNVWYVPKDDPSGLADGIKKLALDPDLRQRLSAGAYEVASQFSWDRIAARTLSFYESLEDPRKKGERY